MWIPARILFFFLFAALVSSQLLTYDPTAGSATPTLIKASTDAYRWFYKREVASSPTDYEYVEYDSLTNTPLKTQAYSATAASTLKALSPEFTCAVFSDATSASQKLQIVKYDLLSASGSNVEDLIVSGIIATAAAADSKQYEVSDMCDGLKIDNTVYHFDSSITSAPGTSAFVADTIPTGANAWTGPVFSQNFDFVAANQGLYVYTERTTPGSGGGSYSKLTITTSFLANKRVLTTDSAIVVFSWVATADPNVKNWKVDAFSYPASKATVTSAGSFSGTSYDTTVNAPPTMMVSGSMQTIIVYGKITATDNFIKGKVFNFVSNSSLELSFPAWVTATKSVFDVSDTYFYARNVENKAGTTSKFHGGYYIYGNQLFENFQSIALVNAQMTNWEKSLIYETPSNNLRIVRQHVSSNIVTLQDEMHSPNGEFVLWEKKQGVATADVTGAGTSLNRVEGNGIIFFVSKPSAVLKKFYSISLDPIAGSLVVVDAQTNQLHELKAHSKNMKCALIFDGTDLKTFSFNSAVSATVTQISTIPSTLYTGEVIGATTKFDVSDDCRGVRINSKILHFWNNGANFFADTFPSVSGVSSLVNPAFSEDFSVAVVDSGIHLYNAKSAVSTPGSYSLARADTFLTKKKIFRSFNGLVIFTWVESTTAGKFNFKLQFNTIQGSTVTKIVETTGQTTDEPNILVSQKLSKVIVFGKNNTDPTKPFYAAQTAEFFTSSVRNLELPSTITQKFNQIVITDEFLYARNLLSTDTKHYGYVFFGTSLIESFNQDIPRLAPDYVRSFIAADPSKKMALVYEFTNGNFIKLVKVEKKGSMDVLNPNTVSPYDMTFSYLNGQSYESQRNPYFGRFMHTSDSGAKLNYIEYDPSQTGKKKIISSATVPGGLNVIKATSPLMDCAVLYVTGGTVYNLAGVSTSGAGTITITNQMATIVTGNAGDLTAPNVATAASSVNGILVGNGCWAYKIGALIYFKGTSTYTKSAQSATAGFATAVFDQNLKFAFAGGKVYKHAANDYAQIITVTGLKTTVKLYPSLDETRLLIVSYQILSGSPGYSLVNKLYALNGAIWSEISLPSNLASFDTAESIIPQITFSSSLDSILVFYAGGTATMKSNVCNAVNIRYSATATITPYQTPTKFDTISTLSQATIFENYLHVISVENLVLGEIIYKIDKTNFRFVQISQKPLTDNEVSQFSNAKFQEANNQLTVLYQFYQISARTINIIKRQFGSTETQSMLKGVQSRDGGLLVQGSQVFLCPSGCRTCVSSTTCTTCMTGFALSGGLCIRCFSLCVSCASDNPYLCIGGCVDGYYDAGVTLPATTCNKCDQRCLTCSGGSNADCLMCKIGFYLHINVCIQCIDNCLSCTGLSTSPLCDVCKLGYVYSSATKSCVKCIAGCTNCKADKIYECSKCGEGFESIFVSNVLSTCQPCPAQCKSCLSGVCTECRTGFRLFNDKCVEQCKLPCLTCSETNPTKCASCPAGYTLNGQSCDPNLTCSTSQTCTTCPIGYNLAAKQCTLCNGGANCRQCDAININKCALCTKGFYLTASSTCSPCTAIGCTDCANQAYCSQCKDGFVLTGASSSAKCTKCDDSCETCFDSPVNCDKCANGFTKRGWSCVNNNHIKLNITIDRVFASLTTSDYIKIEQDLSEKTGRSRNQINIEVLRSGSVVLEATINLANKDQQAAIISALESSFAVNSAIGGYNILSSSFLPSLVDNNSTANTTNTTTNTTTTVYQNVYIQDDAKAKEYRDIAVIVGIVIPIGLSNYLLSEVIVFVVLFILYKKQLICANNGPVKVNDLSTNEIDGMKQKDSSLKEINRGDNHGESVMEIGLMPKTK